MLNLLLRAFIEHHRDISLAMMRRVLEIYRAKYEGTTGLITFMINEPDNEIRTTVMMFVRTAADNVTKVYSMGVATEGRDGRVMHYWNDGRVKTSASGNILIEEIIQTSLEFNDLNTYMDNNADFPNYVYGVTQTPLTGQMMFEDGTLFFFEDGTPFELE